MYYLDAGYDKHIRFRNAVVLALVVHAALIYSIGFEGLTASPHSSRIEVTLTTRPTTTAPDDARNIAQANQQGSGDEAQLDELTSETSMPALEPAPQQTLPPQQEVLTAPQRETLTTTSMSLDAASKSEDIPEQTNPVMEGISPEVDRLARELASLEAELDGQTRSRVAEPRVRRLTAASAKQSADAAYLLDWRKRLEAVGNKYYPQASVRYGIYGNVRLLVVIRHDGSLEDVKVLSSSGYAVLDEAAIKIVRMAAPYSPFPPELRATTDKLEIIRTWQYLENQLSSNQDGQ